MLGGGVSGGRPGVIATISIQTPMMQSADGHQNAFSFSSHGFRGYEDDFEPADDIISVSLDKKSALTLEDLSQSPPFPVMGNGDTQ